ELLCGKVPFTGDSEWEVLKAHETRQPEWPPHLTAVERAVLQRCLQKDPAARFQSVHDIVAAFGAQTGTAIGTGTGTGIGAAPRPGGPPPLPAVPPPPFDAPPPIPTAPRLRRRSLLPAFALAFVCGLLGITLVWLLAGVRPVRTTAAATTRAGASAGTDLGARLAQFVASAQRSARLAAQRQRPPRLQPLDAAAVAAPPDLDLYRQQVAQLADVPEFTAGHARRLEWLGRPAVLAAVALLQELDYEDLRHCRRAAHLHDFLGQTLGFDGLAVESSGCDPTPAETCRFAATADAWRRLAESFVRDDAAFRAVRIAHGKAVAEVVR
ncbi:MAG: hypothetical protein JNL08_00400, partial [Planctomycetes bacterium]|nr:hypothetical protein [Planctomycetota bacterium]